MRRVLFSLLLSIIIVPSPVFAQRDSTRTTFLDAESWFLFEEYAEALPLYQSLLEQDPDNDNLKYKIGVCLLNDPYQRDKSIQYLLEACKNINEAYREGRSKERSAPPEALYYLGNAYLANELLDSAIESYEKFLEIMDLNVYNEDLVLEQIKACNNAKRLMTMPVDIDLTLLDTLINTRYADIDPVVSGDGTKMAFVTRLPFYDAAYITEKTQEGWSHPKLITQLLGFDADIYPVALSYDGTEMILYYDDDYIGNLYYSRLENGLWTPATKMNENISTKYWESNACFSKDGKTLYFTSNRKGTNGGLDIYRSEIQPDGRWGEPVNLGTTINTRYNEECPYISNDGQTLYFSSYGHYNMGGYDIFYSRKNSDGTWAEPVNVGYPINTTDDDLFFQPVNNGNGAFYAMNRPGGMGRHDIYYMNIYSADNPRFYTISGSLSTADGGAGSSPVAIYVIESGSRDTILYTTPSKDGEYSFQVEQGNYDLHFGGEGYEEVIRPLYVTAGTSKQGIRLEENIALGTLEPVEPVEMVAETEEVEEGKIQLEDSRPEIVADSVTVAKALQDEGATEEAEAEQAVIPVESGQEEPMDTGRAMVQSPDKTSEVDSLYENMLGSSQGVVKEILESLDLQSEGVLTVDAFIDVLSARLAEHGMSKKEIDQTLSQLFGDRYKGEMPGAGKPGWLLPLLIAAVGAGLIWFVIAWWRRKKREEKGD